MDPSDGEHVRHHRREGDMAVARREAHDDAAEDDRLQHRGLQRLQEIRQRSDPRKVIAPTIGHHCGLEIRRSLERERRIRAPLHADEIDVRRAAEDVCRFGRAVPIGILIDQRGVGRERGVVIVAMPRVEGVPIEARVHHRDQHAAACDAVMVHPVGAQHHPNIGRDLQMVVADPRGQRRLEDIRRALGIGAID